MKAAMERRAQPGVERATSPSRSDRLAEHDAPDELHATLRPTSPTAAGSCRCRAGRSDEDAPSRTDQSRRDNDDVHRPAVVATTLADVMREAGLATVTSLPIAPRDDDAIDEDLDGVELAQTIPMPGVWTAYFYRRCRSQRVPRAAASQHPNLWGWLVDRSTPTTIDHSTIDSDDHRRADGEVTINLDDVTIDAEIVDVSSADALLDRWSQT